MTTILRSVALALSAMAIAGCAGNPTPLTTGAAPGSDLAPRSAITVNIANSAYSPKTITIKAGTTIKFVNKDPITHTATAFNGTFKSPLIDPNKAWKHTFKTAGKFKYYCQIHPYMRGVIKVTQ